MDSGGQTGPSRGLRLFIIAGAVVLATLPLVITNRYLMHCLVWGFICIIPTLGLTLFVGTAGQISVGHAAFFGIGAYTSAILLKRGVPFPIAFLLAGAVTGACAGFFGLAVLKSVKGVYLAPATFSFSAVVSMFMTNLVKLTGGPSGFTAIPNPQLGPIKISTPARAYYLVLAIVIIAYFVITRIVNSRVGYAFRAIANNELAAGSLGIDVYRTKVLCLALSGVLTGVGGSLYASYANFIAPKDFGQTTSIMFLSMAVVGGLGHLDGAALGGLTLVIVPELLRGLQRMQLVAYGLMLILVLIFWPKGIAGLVFDSKLSRWRARKTTRPVVGGGTSASNP